MKKIIKRMFIAIAILAIMAIILYLRLQPARELNNVPLYQGVLHLKFPSPNYDKSKKTVLIIADNNWTEMFDMMAPYYLFATTQKANVYIVAEKKYPIAMKKGPYILPHFTFKEIDSMQIHADVIVIPFMNDPEGHTKVEWIKHQYSDSTRILAICDGAWTAAATGIYDGKLLTCHATDYKKVKKNFSKPVWVQQVSCTKSGNLYSTAGVSNAVEGSLTVINELFGRETMLSVLKEANYYQDDIKTEHKSIAVDGSAMVAGLTKVIFKRNKNVGILLQDGISEFELAAIFDSYTRTLPSSIRAFTINGPSVTTKNGLTLIPTGDLKSSMVDELHVLKPETLSKEDSIQLMNLEIVAYHSDSTYIINQCLERVQQQYGNKFQNLVRLALDYN
jgi:putative intracellular protease/amidase